MNDFNYYTGHLIDAAGEGEYKRVKWLVKKGADIHDNYDEAFRMACQCGHIKIVKYLHKLGCDINAKNGYALTWAAWVGHTDFVEYLIRHGNNLKGVEKALEGAKSNNHTEIINMLKRLLKIPIDHLIPIDSLSNKDKYKFLECSICLMYVKNVFFDCGHGLCPQCSCNVLVCPFCQKRIEKRQNVIF